MPNLINASLELTESAEFRNSIIGGPLGLESSVFLLLVSVVGGGGIGADEGGSEEVEVWMFKAMLLDGVWLVDVIIELKGVVDVIIEFRGVEVGVNDDNNFGVVGGVEFPYLFHTNNFGLLHHLFG